MVMLLVSCVLFLSIYALLFVLLGVIAGTSERTTSKEGGASEAARILILIPAYNEGEFLRPTLRNIRGVDYPAERFHVVVIADNCTDDTELVARQEGCEVWLRTDLMLRGKGHALTWALGKVNRSLTDAVAVIDADTVVSSNLLRAFDRELHLGYLAIQARSNFEFSPATPSWLSLPARAANSAYDRYVARPRSRFRLYQGLHGTGFCLSTRALEIAPWCAGSICEDLEYGFELAKHGIAIRFIEDASITATMTGKMNHAGGQRERWAGGTYALTIKLMPRLLVQGIRMRDWRSLESCIHLLMRSRVPVAVLTAITVIYLLSAWRNVHLLWWVLLGSAIVLQFGYLLIVLSTTRKESSFGRMLLWLCVYVGWIFRQHLSALLNLRHATWNRTERG